MKLRSWLLALSLSISCGDRAGVPEPVEAPAFPVLGGWPDPDVEQEATLPWTLEESSEAVAHGVVGDPYQAPSGPILRLKLTEVYKGQAEVGPLLPTDAMPFIGCNPPASIPRPSEQFPPGTEVTAYLSRDGAGRWQLDQLVSPAADGAAIRRYLTFRNRLGGPLEEVLPPETVLGTGSSWALLHSGTLERAVPQLWAMLGHTLGRAESEDAALGTHRRELATALSRVNVARLRAAVGPQAFLGTTEQLRARPERAFGDLLRHLEGG